MTTFVILIFGFWFLTCSQVLSFGTFIGFENEVVVENMEFLGTDLVVMTTNNHQQCLRLCWLYTDCTIMTFYPHKLRCRLTTDSPDNLTTVVAPYQDAITVDLREASIRKTRLFGCDLRPCAANELCVPVVDPDTYKCLPLGYTSCPSPPPSSPNTVQTMDGVSKVIQTCKDGYVMSGSNDVTTCDQATGLWSAIDVTCTFKDCGTPPTVDGATTAVFETFYNAKAFYTCYDGYATLSSNMEITCQANSQWTAPPSSCALKTCSNPVNVINGSVSVLERVFVNPPPGVSTQELTLSYGSTALHICNEGFQPPTAPEFRSQCQSNGTWESTSSFTCTPVDCGRPPAIANTWSSFNSTTYPSTTAYKCVEGYENVTESTMEMTCVANGTWTGSDITCVMVDCGTPPEEKDAMAVHNYTTYLSEARYTCNAPTVMYQHNVQSRVCQSNGKWSGEEILCILCGNPPEISNSSFNITRRDIIYVTEYICDEKFHLLNGHDRYKSCNNGTWEGDDPVCLPISCGDPPSVSNTSVVMNGTVLGSMAIYSCDEGFVPAENWTIICQQNGTWSNSGNRTCQSQNDCGQPPSFPNTIPSYTNTDPITDVTYNCKPGYILKDVFSSAQLKCTSGTWLGDIAFSVDICDIINCESPPSINNVISDYNTTTLNSTVVYQCDTGYFPVSSDHQIRICNESGKWSGIDDFECFSSTCGEPPFVSNAVRKISENIDVGSIVSYSCDEGFELAEDKSEMSCSPLNVWSSNETVMCLELTCGPVPFAANATYTLKSVDGRLQAAYQCNHGYTTPEIRNYVLTCLDTRAWNGTGTQCKLQSCVDPPRVANAISKTSGREIGATVIYECNTGYQHWGFDTRTCTQEGTWSPEPVECKIIDCGEPLDIPNTRKSYNSTTFSNEVHYECESGYRFTLASKKICNEDGVWSNNLVECIKDAVSCPEPPAEAFSTLFYDSLVDRQGSVPVATYVCDHGYTQNVVKYNKTCSAFTEYLWVSKGSGNTCSAKICGAPPTLQDGAITIKEGETYGSKAIYECQSDFEMVGPGAKSCQADGRWSSEVSECYETGVAQFCTEPPEIENAVARVLSYIDEVVYSCIPGYIGRNVSLFCDRDVERWIIDQEITCIPLDCGMPMNVSDASVTVYDTTFGSKAVYECLAGYLQTGPYISVCNQSGFWEGPLTNPCTPIESTDLNMACPNFIPDIPNADGILEMIGEPLKISYTCKTGYSSVTNTGIYEINCLPNGEWESHSHVVCKPAGECGNIPDIENADRLEFDDNMIQNIDSGEVFFVELYRCNTGFVKNGTNHQENIASFDIICSTTNGWNTIPFCEAIDCGPDLPINSTSVLVEMMDVTTFGSQAKLTCRPPYIGKQNVSVCQESGKWTEVEMDCRKSFCDVPPPIDGGKLVPVNVDRESHTSSWLVECHDDYQYLANENQTVNCSLDKDTFLEQWRDNYTMEGCVRSRWTNTSLPFRVKLEYSRQQHFNTIFACAGGIFRESYAEGIEPTIVFRYKETGFNTSTNGFSAMRLLFRPTRDDVLLQYITGLGGKKVHTKTRKTVSIQDGQYITVCCNYFLFNSTIRIVQDGNFVATISFPVPNNKKATEDFGHNWAKYFTINRDLALDFVNITYSTI